MTATTQRRSGADGHAEPAAEPEVDFDAHPETYRHIAVEVDGDVARIVLRVDENGGLVPGYELKLNSYDLGVDIELHDAVTRLRFCHPEVRAVVVTGGLDKVFCAGANIRMLAGSSHPWKVNFCKFTNETRNAIEDATANSGQTYIAAVNGTAAGGGYELALACERIILVDDGSSAVSLPEVALLAVLPGTGGLTRVVDKRGVRKDRADVFATSSEGVRARTAVAWNLVDESVPRSRFDETVRHRAEQLAAASPPRDNPTGITLPPVRRTATVDALTYPQVVAELDRTRGVVTITVRGPAGPPPSDAAGAQAQGVEFWPMAMARELDDAILRLRTNAPDLGTWVLRTEGDPAQVAAYDRFGDEHRGHWFVDEVRHLVKRTFKRLDVTSRSLIALIEPGSCFAGTMLELALACDRQYMLDGLDPDTDDPAGTAEPASLMVTTANDGTYPMGNGLSRLQSRFHGDPAALTEVQRATGRPIRAGEALALGLVTFAPDDIDWADEIRLALEERSSLSPDALTGMEANHRFVGPETVETKIFGRLSAWQNWIFVRPNAGGDDGALCRFGTGRKPVFDRKRV